MALKSLIRGLPSRRRVLQVTISPANLTVVNCRFSLTVKNRRIEQQTSVLTFFSVSQSDPIVKT